MEDIYSGMYIPLTSAVYKYNCPLAPFHCRHCPPYAFLNPNLKVVFSLKVS